MSEIDPRYARQWLYSELGAQGQRKLSSSRVAIIGIGALGTIEATLLARAGIGFLRLVDRDFVELTNLQRQVLFDENDAHLALPKAEAAKSHLLRANSTIRIEAVATELNPSTAKSLLDDVDLVVDGSDNFEVRYLINDACVERGLPWIYAAAVGTTGLLMPVIPGTTPCLRCVFEEPPPPGSAATCDTAGVLGMTTSTVGSLAALEALKILSGRADSIRRGLLQLELWSNELHAVTLENPRKDCPCCGRREFPFLTERRSSLATSLCGRDAIQVAPATRGPFDFDAVKLRLAGSVALRDNGFLTRFEHDGKQVTLFRDGRAIVKGTTDPSVARTIYARFIGQ